MIAALIFFVLVIVALLFSIHHKLDRLHDILKRGYFTRKDAGK